jgi:hypothetical protein
MSETTYQTTRASSSSSPFVAVLGATAAAVAIWIVATLAHAELTVSFGAGQPIQKITVRVVAALVGSLAGGLLATARRFTTNARAINRHRDPLALLSANDPRRRSLGLIEPRWR